MQLMPDSLEGVASATLMMINQDSHSLSLCPVRLVRVRVAEIVVLVRLPSLLQYLRNWHVQVHITPFLSLSPFIPYGYGCSISPLYTVLANGDRVRHPSASAHIVNDPLVDRVAHPLHRDGACIEIIADVQHIWDLVCSFCTGDSVFLLGSMKSSLQAATRQSPAFVFLGGLNCEHHVVPWDAPENFLSDRQSISWADSRSYLAEHAASALEVLIHDPTHLRPCYKSRRTSSPVSIHQCDRDDCGGRLGTGAHHPVVLPFERLSSLQCRPEGANSDGYDDSSCEDDALPVVFPFDRHLQERSRRPWDSEV
jgi:hypothetical protein